MSAFYEIDYSDYVDKFTPHVLRTFDFDIKDGDFKQGNTVEQESYIILEVDKGNFYESVRLGLNINKYINADVDKNGIKRKIRDNLEQDGFIINKIYVITENDLNFVNIEDPELLAAIKQNGFLISLDIER